MSTKDKKIKIFYIETKHDIAFYSTHNDNKLILIKNAENQKRFEQVKKSNKFEFVNLLA